MNDNYRVTLFNGVRLYFKDLDTAMKVFSPNKICAVLGQKVPNHPKNKYEVIDYRQKCSFIFIFAQQGQMMITLGIVALIVKIVWEEMNKAKE